MKSYKVAFHKKACFTCRPFDYRVLEKKKPAVCLWNKKSRVGSPRRRKRPLIDKDYGRYK